MEHVDEDCELDSEVDDPSTVNSKFIYFILASLLSKFSSISNW
jgi:hypothetical protein